MSRWRLLNAEGRLFGRLNVIDAAVLLLVFLLLPLAYGAYLLFRPAPARILALQPSSVPEGTMQVNLRGEGLRPYLRVTVGGMGATFLFADPTGGVLQLPALPAGAHDVVLMDEETEIERLPAGLVVEAPTTALFAVGAFADLAADKADALAASLRAAERQPASWGEVMGFQPPERSVSYLEPSSLAILDGQYLVRAVLKLSCLLGQRECRVKEVALKPGVVIPVQLGNGTAAFRIDEIFPAATSLVDVLIRIYVSPEELALLQRGRTDDSFPARDALRPALVSVTPMGENMNRERIANVRVRVPAVPTAEGWAVAFDHFPADLRSHNGRALRVGEIFDFNWNVQRVNGRIVAIEPEASR